MKKIILNQRIVTKTTLAMLLVFVMTFISCEFEFNEELPGANSKPDETPPTALFAFQNGELTTNFNIVTFANESSNATTYLWDFDDNGATSTEIDPTHEFPGEGKFNVTLTVSDSLNQTSMFAQEIELIEPEFVPVPDPIILNPDFDRLDKTDPTKNCTCLGWINKDLGDQGESTSSNGDDVVRFDNNEPDIIYQEFAVQANSKYRIEVPIRFQLDQTGTMPSKLEIRVLKGQGYIGGYTPVYAAEPKAAPERGYGYKTIDQVEKADNNILFEIVENPAKDEFIPTTYEFNSGSENSVAIFVRGIGGVAGGNSGFNSGDEEIRLQFLRVKAVNQQ